MSQTNLTSQQTNQPIHQFIQYTTQIPQQTIHIAEQRSQIPIQTPQNQQHSIKQTTLFTAQNQTTQNKEEGQMSIQNSIVPQNTQKIDAPSIQPQNKNQDTLLKDHTTQNEAHHADPSHQGQQIIELKEQRFEQNQNPAIINSSQNNLNYNQSNVNTEENFDKNRQNQASQANQQGKMQLQNDNLHHSHAENNQIVLESNNAAQSVNNVNGAFSQNYSQNNVPLSQQQVTSSMIQNSILQLGKNTETPSHVPSTSVYPAYTQALLTTPNPSAEPTEQNLEHIYNRLKDQFPECMPQQIILLLYNNLIKIPREELIEQEGQKFDERLTFDGGQRYQKQIRDPTNPASRVQLSNFQLRKGMVHVYVTKGYGVKVYQQYIQKIHPTQQPIDKDKFKAHFVNIYKIIIKKVEEFLANTADRQFQPMTKMQFQKTLGDVINCRKNFSAEFCQIFFRILQSTFDTKFQRVPNQSEVAFFYRTIISRVRQQNIVLARKLHPLIQQKDMDIWSQQFEKQFLMAYVTTKKISQARLKLVRQFPQYEGLLTEDKLVEKIEKIILQTTRWLIIQNQKCQNPLAFVPNEIDKRFILKADQLIQSRIKLVKTYIKRPTDARILSSIVAYIKSELQKKYVKQSIPSEVMQKSTVNQVERSEQLIGLQNMTKLQIGK